MLASRTLKEGAILPTACLPRPLCRKFETRASPHPVRWRRRERKRLRPASFFSLGAKLFNAVASAGKKLADLHVNYEFRLFVLQSH